ncbi:MAG: hypothetical protein SV598_05115 [Pseudomonadota bacterium]|nr:hypothetical protein [Pseudomonadota bacterium]
MTQLSLIIIPLIAGYSWANSWHLSRYRIARSNGYTLYFSAALYGVAILVMAGLTLMLLTAWEVGFVEYLAQASGLLGLSPSVGSFGLQVAALLLVTILYGIVGGHFLNLLTGTHWPYKLAIKNADFERLVLRAIERSLPMLVTLENGKVYVGYVIRTIDPLADEKELRLLPVFSGFRSPETGQVTFSTNYSEVLVEISEEIARMVKPRAVGRWAICIPVTLKW